MNQRARAGDLISFAGNAFPDLPALIAVGNLAAYQPNLDNFYVPPSFGADRHGSAAILTDAQVSFGTRGAGGTGSDVLRLLLVDASADVAGSGTVTSSSTAVTGIGTHFLSEYSVGDYIRALGQSFKITAIASNTALTKEAAGTAWTAAAVHAAPGSFTATKGAGGTLPDAQYFYKITALLPGGESAAATEASDTTETTNNTVNLAWSAVTGATAYRIYRSTTTGTEKFLVQIAPATSYADTGAVTVSTTAISAGAYHWRPPVLATLATLTIPANAASVPPVDLRTGSADAPKGLVIKPGQGIRLVSAGIASGYNPLPANLRVRLGFGAFSLDG